MKGNSELIFRQLRERAEQSLFLRPGTALDHLNDFDAKLHELQVLQIELEMQNEELQRTQLQLELSRQTYLDLYEFAPVGYLTCDPDGRIRQANLTAAVMLGRDRQALVGRPLPLFVAEESRPDLLAHRQTVFRSGAKETCEVRMLTGSGAAFDARIESLVSGSSEGQRQWRLALVDISAAKGLERRLRESEAQFRQLTENIAGVFWLAHAAAPHKVIYVSPAFTAEWGLSRERLLEDPEYWFEVVEAEDRARVRQAFQRFLQDARDFDEEYRIRNPQGGIRWIWARTFAIRAPDGKPHRLAGLAQDVTRRKRLEQQLLQSQKMESIGNLAGGIAHDFNNLLMGIQGRSSLIAMDLDTAHPHREHVQGIDAYVASATKLTQQLLGFAGGGKYEVQPTDLNDLIRSTAELFGRTRKELLLRFDLRQGLWPVLVDRTQIEQVLLNLLINAWQAMPQGGAITLRTVNLEPGESEARFPGLGPGRYVRVEVCDAGVGMDARTRERIFDPFFTTKGMGRGSGLGLASAYGILASHGGAIDAVSAPGKGATFTFWLPAASRPPVRERREEEVILRGTETVLLVDDEAMVLEVGRRMLERIGYTVHTAGNGAEALALFDEHGGEIDLVVLDLIMPVMDGGQAFDRLRSRRSDLPILLSSGYSVDGQASDILARGADGFIQKPFSLAALSRKLREILEGRVEGRALEN